MPNNEKRDPARLTEELSQAERLFREAAAAPDFLSRVQDLRQAWQRSLECDAAVRQAGKDYRSAVGAVVRSRSGEAGELPGAPDELLKPLRRAAQGIPTLGDLRRALFPGSGAGQAARPQSPHVAELRSRFESAEEEAARARGALLTALGHFHDSVEALTTVARRLAAARLALAATDSVAPAGPGPADLDSLALAEVMELPALTGLEPFLAPA